MTTEEAKDLLRNSARRPLVRVISERSRHCTRGWLVGVDNSGNATVKLFAHKGEAVFPVKRLLEWKSANQQLNSCENEFLRPEWTAACKDHKRVLAAIKSGAKRRIQTPVTTDALALAQEQRQTPIDEPKQDKQLVEKKEAVMAKIKKRPFFETVKSEWPMVKLCIEEQLDARLPKKQVGEIMAAMASEPPYKPCEAFAALPKLDTEIIAAINGLLGTNATKGSWSVYRSRIGLVRPKKTDADAPAADTAKIEQVGTDISRENIAELLSINGLSDCASAVAAGKNCVCPEAYDIAGEIAEQAKVYNLMIDAAGVNSALYSFGVSRTSAMTVLESLNAGDISIESVVKALLEKYSKPELVKIIAKA